MRSWLVNFTLILLSAISINGQSFELSETNSVEVTNITPLLHYINDEACSIDIQDLLNQETVQFVPLLNDFIRLRHTGHKCSWYKIDINNQSEFWQDFILKCNDTYIKRIDAYVINEGQIENHFKGGMGEQFSDRKIPYRMSAFPLRIPFEESRMVLFMVENKWDDAQLSIELMNRGAFDGQLSKENLVVGGAVGFIILMIIISFFLWITVNRKLFAFYFLYSFSLLIFFLCVLGFDYQYFFPNSPGIAHNSKLLASTMGIAAMYFLIVQYFIEQGTILNFRQWHSKIAFTLIAFALIVFNFQYELAEGSWFQTNSTLAFIPRALPLQVLVLLILYVLVTQVIKKPIWTNVLFLIGFLGWLSNAFIIVLMNQGIISPGIMPYQLYTTGLLIEASAVTIIMATVIVKMRSEKLDLDFALKTSQLENQQAVKIRELDAAKSRFYTNITHEFRTPLTVIKGLTDQVVGNEEKKELIQRNSNILLRLINQLLEISKADKGELQLRLIQDDVIKYLQYLCESYKSWGATKNIRFHFLPELSSLKMDFDPERLQQVIGNLISNAIKNTESGGDLYFFIKKIEGNLSIVVKDTGAGIHPDNLSNIFDRFYQEKDTVNSQVGSGIGLALVKELIILMGGTIIATSELGVGSEFSITLPITNKAEMTDVRQVLNQVVVQKENIKETSAVSHIQLTGTEENGEKNTVLIVEDNADVRHYVALCLQDAFHVSIAQNGQEGVDMAINAIPDLIISDVMMPVKNGLELCEELKTNILTSHIPIILLTAKADQEAKVQGLMRGADAYLSKPFDKEELIVRVTSLTEQRQRIQKHYLTGSNQIKGKDHALENQFLSNIQAIIMKELTNTQFDVQRLAREIGMSRSQVYRKVKALTGRSIANYVRYIRLQEGKRILENSDKTISEVAYEVGFSDLPYFSKAFSEEFGYPPNATRK